MQAHILTDGKIHHTRDLDEVRRAHAAGQLMWLDLEARSPELDQLLAETFHIHPVAAEDLWVDRRLPKVEAFDGYLLVLAHGVRRDVRPTQIVRWTLGLLLGRTYIISHSGTTGDRCDPSCAPMLKEGPARVAHLLLDRLVDGHVTLIEDLAQRVDHTEMEIVKRGSKLTMRPFAASLFELRQSMQTLARLARRQLTVIAELHDGRFAMIPAALLPYYRDVYDHFVRVSDKVEDCQEAVQNTLEALVQVQSSRINSVMKTLTVLSTVMLPLTFIASVFGMNFRYLPWTEHRWGMPAVLGLMATAAVGFVLVFKRRGWL